ncbi:MAG: hypothetical protein ACM3SV_05495 [Betaproteobacteria bacterium]
MRPISKRCVAAAAALLLAACAEPERRVEETPPPPPPEQKLQSQPLKYLAGRNLKPQPTRPLNVRSRCTHRDAVGTRTRLDLLVKNAEVKTFAVEVAIPKRGTCRFNLNGFTQREKLPQVLLAAKDGSPCAVRMWEQGSRVTIAFNSCPQACEGETFDYLWPVMVEAKSGRCF